MNNLDEGIDLLLKNTIKQHWIYVASLIAVYDQHNPDSNTGNEFWNWCVDHYQPDGVERVDEVN
jgi:hypothetical protein